MSKENEKTANVLVSLNKKMRLSNDTAYMSIIGGSEKAESLLDWVLSRGAVFADNKIILSYDEILVSARLRKNASMNEVTNYAREFVKETANNMVQYKTDFSEIEKYLPLFVDITINPEEQEVTFEINPKLESLYRGLTNKFYVVETEVMFGSKSEYTRRLYKLLASRRYLGQYVFKTAELRRALNVPESYNGSKVMNRILEPSLKDLENELVGIKVEILKKSRHIVGYKFSWDADYQKENKFDEITDKKIKNLEGIKKAEPAGPTEPTVPQKEKSSSLDERITEYISTNYVRMGIPSDFDWKHTNLATADEIRTYFQANRLLSFLNNRKASRPSAVRSNPMARENFTDKQWADMMGSFID